MCLAYLNTFVKVEVAEEEEEEVVEVVEMEVCIALNKISSLFPFARIQLQRKRKEGGSLLILI